MRFVNVPAPNVRRNAPPAPSTMTGLAGLRVSRYTVSSAATLTPGVSTQGPSPVGRSPQCARQSRGSVGAGGLVVMVAAFRVSGALRAAVY